MNVLIDFFFQILEQLVRVRYAEVLRNLRGPAGSGKMIQNLTLLAEDQRQYAHIIASVILEEIPRSDIPRKYVLLCLVDSIVRKCRSGSIFFPYFLPYIAPYFAEAYTVKTSTQILRSLEKLLKVWNDSFPKDIVKKLIQTTNNVRAKLNEPPIEIDLNKSSTMSQSPSTDNKSNINNVSSVSPAVSAQIPNLDNARLNEVYIQLSKTIIKKANLSDDNNVLLNKLVIDPNIHKIAYLNSQGKIQESQKLTNVIIRSLENNNIDQKHAIPISIQQSTHNKRLKQDIGISNNRISDINLVNQNHFSHSTPQVMKIATNSATQSHIMTSNIQGNIVNNSQLLSSSHTSINNTSVSSTAAAVAAAAAAAAAAVVQSKAQIQHQKHGSSIVDNQPIINNSQTKMPINQVILSQQLNTAINTSSSSNNSNSAINLNSQVKKTFSPRFLENSTSSILLSLWNQLFQSSTNKTEITQLKKINSSIIDGKGDQSIFLEGLQISEISDLLLLYKKLQENVDASTQFKKSIWLKSHFVKKRIIDNISDFNLQTNISMYYNDRPNQCHTCGFRFVDSKKKESHISIHLSKNLIFRQKKQLGNSQVLWPSLQDWIYGSDSYNEASINSEILNDNKDISSDNNDKGNSNINDLGNDFLNESNSSHSNDKIINFNDLFNAIFDKKARKNSNSDKKNEDLNSNELMNDGKFDSEYFGDHSSNKNFKKNVFLDQYISYIDSLNHIKCDSILKKLNNINDITDGSSNDLDRMMIKNVDDICSNLSSLWNEMTQSVISTYTPVDPLHLICDICHESLPIKWCSLIKSWISIDAIALTSTDTKDIFDDQKDEESPYKLTLAVIDLFSENKVSKLNNVKERINNSMLQYIQWKYPDLSNENPQLIEFEPFDEDFLSYRSNLNQNLIGDKFVTAHKSCFIHYFIYNDINKRLSFSNQEKKKKYSYIISDYRRKKSQRTTDRTKINKNIVKRFSFI